MFFPTFCSFRRRVSLFPCGSHVLSRLALQDFLQQLRVGKLSLNSLQEILQVGTCRCQCSPKCCLLHSVLRITCSIELFFFFLVFCCAWHGHRNCTGWILTIHMSEGRKESAATNHLAKRNFESYTGVYKFVP